MSTQVVLVFLSSLLGIACFLPYIRDIFRHTTKPHSYTWFIWSLLQGLAAVAMWDGGAGIAIASTTIGAVLCALIFVLSLKYGTTDMRRFDVACLAGALIALGVYLFLQDALLSIIFVTLTDLFAFLPTLRKTLADPRTETASTHIMSGLSILLAIGALSRFNPTTMTYLVAIMCMDFALGFLVVFRKR